MAFAAAWFGISTLSSFALDEARRQNGRLLRRQVDVDASSILASRTRGSRVRARQSAAARRSARGRRKARAGPCPTAAARSCSPPAGRARGAPAARRPGACSRLPGCSKALRTALRVISLNITRWTVGAAAVLAAPVLPAGASRWPRLRGQGRPRGRWRRAFGGLLQLLDELLLALDDDVGRLEAVLTSTPRSFFGRSLTWPSEALTRNFLPRYLPIVFALAGDSTMTREFAI